MKNKDSNGDPLPDDADDIMRVPISIQKGRDVFWIVLQLDQWLETEGSFLNSKSEDMWRLDRGKPLCKLMWIELISIWGQIYI